MILFWARPLLYLDYGPHFDLVVYQYNKKVLKSFTG